MTYEEKLSYHLGAYEALDPALHQGRTARWVDVSMKFDTLEEMQAYIAQRDSRSPGRFKFTFWTEYTRIGRPLSDFYYNEIPVRLFLARNNIAG